MTSKLPTRVFAGVTIPDTPLISKALDFARAYGADYGYNHIYRSFLFGFIFGSKNPEFKDRDLEAHAIAAILHDIGWDPTGTYISKDKRFEVDGANAAREFLKKEAPDWDKHRLQLVWDAIALHTTSTIAPYKEPEVAATASGIGADLFGPDNTPWLSWDEYNAVVKELPRHQLGEGIKELLCGFCQSKPEATFDNFQSMYGEKYVDGYSEKRAQSQNFFEGTIAELDKKDA